MIFRLAAAGLLVLFASAAEASQPNPHNTLDCLFCHGEVPRFGVDTRETVTFYRFEGDDPQLCYVCHRPDQNLHPLLVRPGEGRLATNDPRFLPLGTSEEFLGTVVCTTCHFVHAADSDHALLRGFSGTQNPWQFANWQDFCRHCHGSALESRSPHGGDDSACAYCHTVRPDEGVKAEIMARGVKLCNFCHGVMQEDHLKGINPFEGKVDCLSCHDPHLGPDRPARLKKRYYDFLRGTVLVNPHGRRTLCSPCHIEDKMFTLLTPDRDALCNRCHASGKIVGSMHPLGEIPPGMKVPEGWPTRQGRLTCLTCHLPGHLDERGVPGLLRGGPYEYRDTHCAACHDFTELSRRDPHDQIRQLKGCDTCHDRTPVFGMDTAQTVTFKASINILCLRCHEDIPHPGNAVHTVALDERGAASVPEYLPLDRYARATCATCHNPHLPGKENHKLRETLSGVLICTDCHGM